MIKIECQKEEDFLEALHRTVKELGQPKRQEILDHLWAGKSVGEIVDLLQIETCVVSQVVCNAIEKQMILSRKSP